MPTLTERVAGLSREEAIEAALALAEEVAEGREGLPEAREFADEVAAAPYGHLPEVEDLARLLLVAAGSTEEWSGHVEEILGSVGRKTFVFGGTELIALSTLGVVALALILARGKSEERERLEFGEDGKLTYEKETVYATSTGLVRAISKVFEIFRQP